MSKENETDFGSNGILESTSSVVNEIRRTKLGIHVVMTSIRYEIASESTVSIRIFNSLGEEITTLVNGPHRPGFYEVQWDGRNAMGSSVSSGIYYCVLKAGGYVATAKVVLLK